MLTSPSPFKFSELPQALRDHLQSSLTDPEVIGTELNRCFDFKSVSELIRFVDSNDYEMKVFLKVSDESQKWWDFNMIVTESDLIVDGSINANLVLAREENPLWNSIHSDEFTDYTRNGRKRYYLPASRSGILQSYRVMASSLMERVTRSDNFRVPTLSSVIVDFMKHLPIYEENKESYDAIFAIADA